MCAPSVLRQRERYFVTLQHQRSEGSSTLGNNACSLSQQRRRLIKIQSTFRTTCFNVGFFRLDAYRDWLTFSASAHECAGDRQKEEQQELAKHSHCQLQHCTRSSKGESSRHSCLVFRAFQPLCLRRRCVLPVRD